MSDTKSKPGRTESILLIAGLCSFLVGAGLKFVSFISEVVLRVTTQPVYDGKSHPEMKDSWGAEHGVRPHLLASAPKRMGKA